MTLSQLARDQPLSVALVLVYLTGAYTYVQLPLAPGLFVPAVIAGAAGGIMLLKNLRRVRWGHVSSIGVFALVALASVVLAAGVRTSPGALKGWIYLTYSLLAGLGLTMELLRWPPTAAERLFLGISLFLLVGVALESFTPLKEVSDAFRRVALPSQYENLTRDLNVFGRARPKLFTSEPSHVAKFLLLTTTMWLILSRWRFRYVAYVAMAAGGMTLIGSPILVLAAPMALVVMLFSDFGGLARVVLRPKVRQLLIIGAVLAVVTAGMGVVATTVMRSRLSAIIRGSDASFVIRVVAPTLVGLDILSARPFFGGGVSTDETIADVTESRFLQTGVSFERVGVRLVNLFWMHWVYLGLVGGAVALFALRRLMRALGVRHDALCWFLILGFSQTMGGYVGVRAWTFHFLVIVTAVLLARRPGRAVRTARGFGIE